MFDPKELCSPYEYHSGPLSEELVESLMLSKKKRVKSPAGAGRKGNTSEAAGKGKTQSKGKETSIGKDRQKQEHPKKPLPKAKAKEEFGQKQTIGRPVLHKRGQKQRQEQEQFHTWRVQQKAKRCVLRRSLSYPRAKHVRCLEEFWWAT